MKKKLITERDVARLAAGSRLDADRDTLITPAARDLAFVRAIEIISAAAPAPAKSANSASRSACCSECAAGRPCCSAKWPPLADGDWLLEVRAGAVRARRIEPRRDG
jgi:hypothetical protein